VGIDRLDDDNDTSDGYWLMTIVVRAFFITEIRLNVCVLLIMKTASVDLNSGFE